MRRSMIHAVRAEPMSLLFAFDETVARKIPLATTFSPMGVACSGWEVGFPGVGTAGSCERPGCNAGARIASRCEAVSNARCCIAAGIFSIVDIIVPRSHLVDVVHSS